MKRALVLAVIVVLSSVVFANAELLNRGVDSQGNRLIYDSDLNITWYDYTRTMDTWETQMNWADALDIDLNGTHYNDWRLPSTVDGLIDYGYDGTTTGGYNITSSELGHLFYTELGNKSPCTTDGTCDDEQPDLGLTKTGDFQNLRPASGKDPSGYWSGTEYSADPSYAWYFATDYGYQDIFMKNGEFMIEFDSDIAHYAVAVRDGDISVAVVPEPISSTLFIVGGAILGFKRFRKK